jgi:hypothetical protein
VKKLRSALHLLHFRVRTLLLPLLAPSHLCCPPAPRKYVLNLLHCLLLSLLSLSTTTPTTTSHHSSPRLRQHAVQQHPNCSFQGGHRHCVPAAYVYPCLSALRKPELQPLKTLQITLSPTSASKSNISLVARVKKIISQDDDINSCSNNAAFVITVATEMFLQHLVEQSHNVVKSERKPRRNIQYRDVGECLSSRPLLDVC